jgi:hypothetical protein
MTWSYWAREIAGWVLVLLGLWAFWAAYALLLDKKILQAPQMVFVGFIVFRGGIHVLKVAVAVRTAQVSADAGLAVDRRLPRTPRRPVGPTPIQTVLPGPKSQPPAANGTGST